MTGATATAASEVAEPAPAIGHGAAAPWLTPVRIALLVWAVMSLLAIIVRWDAIVDLRLSDTDDAMRMAQVRDVLAGQGWWDLTQYRVNPAGGGVLMHWSRLVDAPLVAGLGLLEPLVGQALAERIVMALWPLILGAGLGVACVLGYRDLSDRRIAYVVPLFLAASGYILVQFRPLRVDHHGWQILLAMLVMGQALRPATARAGAIGGLCAAALLAVSIEGLPIVALFAGLAALRWALHGRSDDRARLLGYMGGLAGGALLFQFLTRGPAGIVGDWCDSLSAPYLAAFTMAAVAVFAVAAADPARRMVRFALLAGAGAIAAGALVATAPQCAAGPFASLDPIVVDYWYRHILEGQPVWASDAHTMIHVLVPSITGLVGSLLARRHCAAADDRRAWTTVIVALLGAAALSLLVLRSASTAHLFALPGCVWLALRIWDWARAISSTLLRVFASALAGLTLPLIGAAAATVALTPMLPAPPAETGAKAGPYQQTCLDPAAIAALDALPPTTVLTPIDLGAPLIFWTRHSMVATGHHRNREAMADALHIFTGDPAKAEALVRKQAATLVVFCPTANDFGRYRRARKDALAAQLYAGKPPAWLEPVPIASREGLSVWRVRAAAVR